MLADQWGQERRPVRRECGYGLLYEASKFSGKKAPSEEFFFAHVERIADTIGTESEKFRLSMGAALMGIGKRSAVLNEAALKVARDVGPIEVHLRQRRVRAVRRRQASDHRPAEGEVGGVGVAGMASPMAAV